MPEILFKNRENLKCALKFNKICHNLEFYILNISYNLKHLIEILRQL